MEGACDKHRRHETRMTYCIGKIYMNRARRGRERTWEDGKNENCKNAALMWTEIF
jgi:hypothetical protein